MKKNKNLKKLMIVSIAMLMCLGAVSLVDAQINGSEITATTTSYTAGTSATLQFHFTYVSPDYEYIDGFYLDFPSGVTVTGAQASVGGAPWNMETGDGALTSWGDLYGYCSGFGYFSSDQDFTVDVDIDSGFSGDMVIDWGIFGDCYGSADHALYGTVTITEGAADYCYFEDDFSGGFTDWTVYTTGTGPDIVTTSNAGGTSPEARFYYYYCNDGDYIMSNAVDTSSESDLWMGFRSMINHYSASYVYNLFVEVTPDGGTSWFDVTPWTNPLDADYAASRYILNIPEAIGTQTSVRFRETGDDYGLNYWYIDDVKICDTITYKDAAMLNIIQPDPYATGGWTNLIPVQTRVANNGNTPQSIDVNVKISHEVGGGTLLFEDFDSAWDSANPPIGWRIIDNAGGSDGIWNNNDWYRYTSYGGCPRVYYSPYEDDQDEWLISPSINCGAESEVHLFIDYMYSYIYNSVTKTTHLYIEGSTDGGTSFLYPIDDWQDGDLMEGAENDVDYDISSWAAFQPDVQIRFRMVNPGSGSSYRSCYWYFNDLTVYAPTTTVLDYDVTKTESFATAEIRNVLFPDWPFPPAGNYDVTATVTLAGDEDATNDVITVTDMPIGDVDAAILSIDAPSTTTVGPVAYIPEVTVSQVTAWDPVTVPVTYSVYEQPFTSTWETKVTEDFEGYLGFNTISHDNYRGIEVRKTDEHEGRTVEATINWLEEPNIADPGEWTIIDDNWDDVTWNPTDARASQGTTSMWMGDPDTGQYPTGSYDWLISPVFNAGDACQVTWDMYHDVENDWDYVALLWSPDLSYWNGFYFPAHAFWNPWTITCPDPSLINDDGSCYVAFLFVSDTWGIEYEGAYIDDVIIRGSAALYSETVDAVFNGAGTQTVTFPPMSGLVFDKNYVVQAAVQHPRDIVSANNELSLAFDTFVKVYNLRTGAAYPTIQAAIDAPETIAGDTIIARDGNYYEDINIWKAITVTGENPPEGGTSYLYGTVDITSDNAIYENMYVKPLTLFTSDQAAIAIYSNNVIVRHNIVEIEGSTSGTIKGIHAYATPSDYKKKIEISDNTVRNVKNCVAGGGGGGTTFYFSDFESDNGGWVPTATWDPVGDWEWSNTYNVGCYVGGEQPPPAAYSGTGLWGTVLCDDYTNSGGETLLSQTFSFTGLTDVHLSFYEWSDLFGSWDYGEVLVNGVQEYYVDTYPGSSWDFVDLNLGAYDNMASVEIVFSMHASTVVEYAGWYLDDVRISYTGSGTPGTYGGAVGIMVQGATWNVDVLNNKVYDIVSSGWAYGIEITPTAADPEVQHFQAYLDFQEDFTGVATGAIPTGWERTDTHWGATATSNAGGVSPEMRFYWSPSATNDFYLKTPKMDTSDFTTLDFSFRHYVSHFTTPYTLKVIAIADGVEYIIDQWDPTASIPATPETYTLTASEGVGALEFQLAWVFSGYSFNINYWYIDDISLTGSYDYYETVYPWPLDVNVEGNIIRNINCGLSYTCPDPPVYPGIMLTVNYATLPTGGPTPADASEVTVLHNWFDSNCQVPALAILNTDLAHCLMATNNYFSMPNGPGSYNPFTEEINVALVYDCYTMAPADGGGSQIVLYGPVAFDKWLGLNAVSNIVSPYYAEVGQPILFDAAASWAKDFTGPFEPDFFWKFDDGFYSMEKQIGHVYTSPGTYEGYLRVHMFGIPEFGIPPIYDWDYFTIIVTEPGAPLGANAGGGSLSHYEVSNGEEITLSGIASGGTEPYTYQWKLGDGRTVNGQNPTVIYYLDEENPVTTTYTVTLTVIDSNYDTATDTATVTVLAPGELNVIIDAPVNSMIGFPVSFISTVSGGTLPYSYSWNFGDGITSTEAKPTHIYENADVYTVTLTITDDLGTEKTATHTIEIESEEEQPAEIKKVTGGFGVKATIAAGDTDCDWTINVDGKLLFFGGEASGTIVSNTEKTVKLPLTFAFGKVNVKVTANELQKDYTAFALGPLFLSVKEA